MTKKHWKRLVAPLIVGIVVAAYLMSARSSGTRPVVPLGPAALQRAAFTGGARISLRYDNVSGPVAGALGHANDLPILSFSWGVSRPSAVVGGKRNPGAVTMADINLVHVIDKYSIKLLHEALLGHGRDATVFIERVQGTPPTVVESLSYKLKDAMVSSDSTSVSASGAGTESISLSFSSITVTYGIPNSNLPTTIETWDQACMKASC